MIRKPVLLIFCILFVITILTACASLTPSHTAIPTSTEVISVHPGTLIFQSVEEDYTGEFYLIQTDGTSLTQLTKLHTSLGSPAWSPDGAKIVFAGLAGQLWVMNADGSGQTELTNDKLGGIYPDWSPDGTQIAYSTWFYPHVSGPAQIYVMNADGSSQRRVTNGSENDFFPQWTPDGKILFLRKEFYGSSGGALYEINPDGSDLVQLTTTKDIGDFALSPDGSKIAIHDKGLNRIAILPLGAGKVGTPVTVIDTDFGTDFVQIAWSPDGQALALARRGLTEIYGEKLHVVNVDGTGLTTVPNARAVSDVAWRPIASP
jgi:Tol biopolymer transport system component